MRTESHLADRFENPLSPVAALVAASPALLAGAGGGKRQRRACCICYFPHTGLV